MKLEQQVTNLELSKKLKELGVKQDSLFYWIGDEEDKMFLGDIDKTLKVIGTPFDGLEQEDYEIIYSAYTVAELGEMLKVAFEKLSGQYINNPRGELKRLWQRVTGFENEADNRAKLIIYLIENKLITS